VRCRVRCHHHTCAQADSRKLQQALDSAQPGLEQLLRSSRER
jgi:hypothetical protein